MFLCGHMLSSGHMYYELSQILWRKKKTYHKGKYILVYKINHTKIFYKYIFMPKPKQLFIIIYVNVCVKSVYSHKAKNNILFRHGKNLESRLSVP